MSYKVSNSFLDMKIGLLLGDSITQQSFAPGGWGARLADSLVRRVDVVNRGFSGYNTRWVANNLDRIFYNKSNLKNQICFMTIFLGANDACLAETADGKQEQHIPVKEYVENLEKISHFAENQLGVAPEKQIFISPPPVDSAAWFEAMKVKYEYFYGSPRLWIEKFDF